MAYLNQHAGASDLIFGASELAFGLGFYGNLRDDSTLGYFTGKRAAYIVVEEPGYGEAFRGFAVINPALGRFVQQTLKDDYQKVYANSVYEIMGAGNGSAALPWHVVRQRSPGPVQHVFFGVGSDIFGMAGGFAGSGTQA